MKIVIEIPTDQYNEIVYVNYERLRDIVRDGVVIEKCEDCISILNRIMEYTYGMLTAEKIGLQHLIKSMMDELSGGGEE